MKRGVELKSSITRTSVEAGNAVFWWLGQMGFIIRTQHWTLALDPYLTPSEERMIPPLLAAQELNFANLILGTHDHGDHIDRPAWPVIAQHSPATRFVVPQTLVSMFGEELGIPPGRFIGIDADSAWEEAGLRIRGVPAAHEFLDKGENGYPYMGYVVEADGVRIYHSGDSCLYDGLTHALQQAGPLDIMILPINGRDGLRYRRGCIGNMGWQEAVDLAGTVQPALFIPSHYEMFDSNRGDISACVEYMEQKYPAQRYWIGAHGEKQQLKHLTE